MKRVISTLLVVAAAAGFVPAQALADTAPPPPRILLDGVTLEFPAESPPAVINNTTLVPFRAIAEALGADVTWNQADWSIDATGLDQQVHLKIDDSTMWVNGKAVPLTVPPQIVNGRTMIPLRAFSTAFGAQVGWDQPSYTAWLISPVWSMRTMAFYALRSYNERQYIPAFSDVAFGWSELKGDGTVDITDSEYRWPEPDGATTGERLLEETDRVGTRRHLMVHMTDVSDELTALVLDKDLRKKAAEEIAAVAEAKGFDGVVLDLEGLGLVEQGEALEQVRDGFTRLVVAVSDELRQTGRQTIVSVHPLNGAYRGYDYQTLVEAADALQIMAHDYEKADRNDPEPVDRVAEALALAVKAVGLGYRHKLLLGIVSSYETAETLPQKVGLAKRYRLGGISVWRLGEMGDATMQALQGTVRRSN